MNVSTDHGSGDGARCQLCGRTGYAKLYRRKDGALVHWCDTDTNTCSRRYFERARQTAPPSPTPDSRLEPNADDPDAVLIHKFFNEWERDSSRTLTPDESAAMSRLIADRQPEDEAVCAECGYSRCTNHTAPPSLDEGERPRCDDCPYPQRAQCPMACVKQLGDRALAAEAELERLREGIREAMDGIYDYFPANCRSVLSALIDTEGEG